MLRGAKIDAEWIARADAEDDPRRAIASGCSRRCWRRSRSTRRIARSPQRLLAERSPEDIAAALVHAHRARLPAPEDADRGCARAAPAAPRRIATAPASRTSSGSAWTSAAARMPIRAGCCRCCAGAGTSPSRRSARSASRADETCSRCRAPSPRAFSAALTRTAERRARGRERRCRIEPARRVRRQRRRAASAGPTKRAPNQGRQPRAAAARQAAAARAARRRRRARGSGRGDGPAHPGRCRCLPGQGRDLQGRAAPWRCR